MRKTPVVLGVLSIVFGALVALWHGGSLAVSGRVHDLTAQINARSATQDPDGHLAQIRAANERMMTETKPYNTAIGAGMVVFSLALIAIGIGLYGRKTWARPASIGWSGGALLWTMFMVWVQVAIVAPHMRELFDLSAGANALPEGMANAMKGTTTVMSIIGPVVFYLPFPLVLLALMGRPSAKNDLVS